MNPKIIRADKSYRKKLIIIYLIVAIIGTVIVEWILPWAKEYILRLEPQTALNVIKIILPLMFLSIVPIALYLLTFGRKVLKYGCLPPPGVKVIKDTKVVEGQNAKFRGRIVVAISLILIFLGLFGAIYTSYMLVHSQACNYQFESHFIRCVNLKVEIQTYKSKADRALGKLINH